MKKIFIIVSILIAGFIIYIVWLLSGAAFNNPQKPQTRYGEFPFVLTYEKDGQSFTVNDTLVCEFDGYGADASRGKFRKWKSYLASGNTRITLFQNEGIEIFYSPNINHWEAGAYYMGDTEIYDSINVTFPNAWKTSDFENKQVNAYIISEKELMDMYKIRLVSWEITPPIENTFK